MMNNAKPANNMPARKQAKKIAKRKTNTDPIEVNCIGIPKKETPTQKAVREAYERGYEERGESISNYITPLNKLRGLKADKDNTRDRIKETRSQLLHYEKRLTRINEEIESTEFEIRKEFTET